MELRRPRSKDLREVEKWEDEVSRQINYAKTIIGDPDIGPGDLEIKMAMESKNPDPSDNPNWPWIDVRDFLDIQAAIDSVPVGYSPGGVVYAPMGIYLCTVGLLNSDRRISFTGDGIDQTILRKDANDIDLLKLDVCYQSIWQKIKDMTLDGNSKTGGMVLNLYQTNYIGLENLKICNSLSANSALYLYEATGTILKDIYLWDNAKSAYFKAVHGCRIFNLKALTGVSAADIDFDGAAQTHIFGFSLSAGDGGVTIRDCQNFGIYGFYQETSLVAPAITIGTSGHPAYDVSINGGTATVCFGANPSVGPLIKVQYGSRGIAIRDMEIMGSQVGVYAGGWIELGSVYGITIENIMAENMSPGGTSAGNLIFSPGGGVGPTGVTINNVNAYSDGGSASVDLKITNGKISNCNVYINLKPDSYNVVLMNCSGQIDIQPTCSRITLINCSGTITDGSGTAERINSPG